MPSSSSSSLSLLYTFPYSYIAPSLLPHSHLSFIQSKKKKKMSNTLFPCLDPNSPAPLPPPSPIQPTCPSLFPSSSSHRPKVKPPRPRSEELSDEILEEFYQKYGVDGEKLEELYRNGGGKRIHELLGSPYSQGVTAWRILTERWEKEFVARMMRKKREAGGWIDRHRPRALDDFICHREKALLLRQLVMN